MWGLNDIKIGDIIGERTDYIKDTHFAEPQMEAAINAVPKERIHDLYAALMELCEEDPLIKVWKDDIHNELYIRLFGEVQKRLSKQHFMRNIICRLLFKYASCMYGETNWHWEFR